MTTCITASCSLPQEKGYLQLQQVQGSALSPSCDPEVGRLIYHDIFPLPPGPLPDRHSRQKHDIKSSAKNLHNNDLPSHPTTSTFNKDVIISKCFHSTTVMWTAIVTNVPARHRLKISHRSPTKPKPMHPSQADSVQRRLVKGWSSGR